MSSSLIMPLYNEVRQVKNSISTLNLDTASDVAYAFILGLGEGDGQLMEDWLAQGDNNIMFNQLILENGTQLDNIISLNGPMKAISGSTNGISSLLGNDTARGKILLSGNALNAICSQTVSINFVISSSNVLNDFVSTQDAINAVAGNSTSMQAFSGSSTAKSALNNSPLVMESPMVGIYDNGTYWISLGVPSCIVTAARWQHGLSTSITEFKTVINGGSGVDGGIAYVDGIGAAYKLVGYYFSGVEMRSSSSSTDNGRQIRYIPVTT